MRLEQHALAGDRKQQRDRPVVFGRDAREHRLAHRGVGNEFRVTRCHRQVGLGQHHRHVGKHAAEERPLRVHLAQQREPFGLAVGATWLRFEPGRDRGTESVPARQHEAALAPAEHPGNRPQVLDARRTRARRGTAADVEFRDLGDRRRRAKVRQELGRLVHQRAIRRVGIRGERVERRMVGRRARADLLGVDQARLHGRRDQRLQVAPAEFRVAVLAGDDLALLGDAQAAGHAACGLRENGFVRRAAAPADGAAAAVEQAQLHAVIAKRVHQPHLGAIQRPVGGEIAAVLVAVRVAEHDLLPVVPLREPRAIERHGKGVAHDGAAPRRGRRSSRTAARC